MIENETRRKINNIRDKISLAYEEGGKGVAPKGKVLAIFSEFGSIPRGERPEAMLLLQSQLEDIGYRERSEG